MEYSTRLLGAKRWSGVAMVEYKLDSRDHSPKLMEVNGRFWGSLQLAVDSGVDFPFLLYQLATGAELRLPGPYQLGVRTRWLSGDVDHLLSVWLLPRRKLFLQPGSPGRLLTFLEFLSAFGPRTRNEVFLVGDRMPGFLEIGSYLQEIPEKIQTVLDCWLKRY
jgi:predicted ATP-grasp superfamily ATP-dependent carboligase